MPLPFSSPRTRIPDWINRIKRAPRNLFRLVNNARHIERLISAPKTIGLPAAASLVRTVNLLVETRCNIRCSCCHYFKAYDTGETGRGLELRQMIELLSAVPLASVAITGGEPLMAPLRVVEAARALLQLGRETLVATNFLPLVETVRGESVRNALLNGLTPSERARLSIRCSVDLEHQEGTRMSVGEYAANARKAMEFLTACGFPVFTRSIVTSRREYDFFKEHVLPLSSGRLARGASIQPDMHALPKFVAALKNGELQDVRSRLGEPYVTRILAHVARGADTPDRMKDSTLRTTPWVLIEVNSRGVKGPSGFLPATAHHPSVVAMLRSYDWLPIADAIVPQITITRNAFPYVIDRRTRSVSINASYLFNRLVSR